MTPLLFHDNTIFIALALVEDNKQPIRPISVSSSSRRGARSEERGGATTTSQQNQQLQPAIHQARNYLARVKSLLGETSTHMNYFS